MYLIVIILRDKSSPGQKPLWGKNNQLTRGKHTLAQLYSAVLLVYSDQMGKYLANESQVDDPDLGLPRVRDSQIYINGRNVYITYIYRGNYLEETRGPGCIFFLYQQKIEPNDQGACFA